MYAVAQSILAGDGFGYDVPSRSKGNQVYVPELDRIVLKASGSGRTPLEHPCDRLVSDPLISVVGFRLDPLLTGPDELPPVREHPDGPQDGGHDKDPAAGARALRQEDTRDQVRLRGCHLGQMTATAPLSPF